METSSFDWIRVWIRERVFVCVCVGGGGGGWRSESQIGV